MAGSSDAGLLTASSYHRAGLSIIPIRTDASKAPALNEWTSYQKRPPTEEELREWFGKETAGIAIVCGRISSLEVIDFDGEGMFGQWVGMVEKQKPGILATLPIIKTPRGHGRHVYLRRQKPARNQKLAAKVGDNGRPVTMIEIKGEGGYVLAPGCPAQCHESGNLYEQISGPSIELFNTLPFIEDETYKILIAGAKSLNEYVKPEGNHEQHQGSTTTDERPGDVYNQQADWGDILGQSGWQKVTYNGTGIYWKRPGKEGNGISATTGKCRSPLYGDLLYVFSTNANPFEAEKAYSKFTAHTLLQHDGDFSKAARFLADRGFGNSTGQNAALSPLLVWKPFPLQVMPAPVRMFIKDGAAALRCDPAFIATPLLSGLAAAIGNTRRIELKDSWKAPAIIWAAVIAESGSLKTPSMKLALEAMRNCEDVVHEENKKLVEEYDRKKQVYDAEVNDWKKKFTKNKELIPPEKPTEPACIRYTVSEITVEALAAILENNPRGILLARDELSGWLTSFDAYKSTKGADVAQWLELHQAGRVTIDRKSGSKKTIHIPCASVSIVGTIQPGILKKVIAPEYFENGLVARLLMAMPPKTEKTWTEASVDIGLKKEVQQIFEWLFALGFDKNNEPHNIPLSPEAKELWIDFYGRFAKVQANADGPFAAALSKLEEHPARFALILSLVRLAARGEAHLPLVPIDQESMHGGILLTLWFAMEAGRIYALFEETEEERENRELATYIQGRGGQITARELTRGPQKFKGKGGSVKAKVALEALVKIGILVRETQEHDGGGRPGEVYKLNNKPAPPNDPTTDDQVIVSLSPLYKFYENLFLSSSSNSTDIRIDTGNTTNGDSDTIQTGSGRRFNTATSGATT